MRGHCTSECTQLSLLRGKSTQGRGRALCIQALEDVEYGVAAEEMENESNPLADLLKWGKSSNDEIGVGPAGRLLDVRGYVWPKIWPAVVYGLRWCGGAGSDGRYVGRLRWSQIWQPLRWPFVLQPDPAAGTLAIFG